MPMTSLPAPPAPRPPGPRRAPCRALAALGLAGTAALAAAGCGSPGDLRSTGAAPTAAAPATVWPERDVSAPEAFDVTDEGPAPVPGLPRLPSDDIRRISARTVLKADAKATDEVAAADPDSSLGDPWPYITDCLEALPGESDCEVRPAGYHDLTGDGAPELIMGVDLAPDLCEVRVYTVRDGTVTRVLIAGGNVRTVEVADGELIVREPDWTKGYESSTLYKWDGEKMAYLGHLIQKADPSGSTVPHSSRAFTRPYIPATPR